MKECINCKAILEDDELFCHECGTKQEIEKTEDLAEETQESQGKKCIHCGETIDDDSMFCPYCGKQQNEPSSEGIKVEDTTSEEDKNAQNLKEAPKEEENPVQEPSENNLVDESKIEKYEQIQIKGNEFEEYDYTSACCKKRATATEKGLKTFKLYVRRK